jgi:hypothetical protein
VQGHDYTQAGAYFITICIRDRECLLGKVVNGEVQLNDTGGWWNPYGCKPQGASVIELDAYSHAESFPAIFHPWFTGVAGDPRVAPVILPPLENLPSGWPKPRSVGQSSRSSSH